MPDEIEIDLEASDRALDRLAREQPLTPEASAEQLRRLEELRAVAVNVAAARLGRRRGPKGGET